MSNLQTEKSAYTGLESPVDVNVDIHKQKCKDHTDENQSFYCEKHYVCICGRCVFSNHFSCLETVVDLNNVQHDEEHANKSVSTLQVLDQEMDHIMAEIDENRQINDTCRSNYAKDIHEFHEALVQQLKMLMIKAEKESDNLHKQNTDVLDETALKCNEHKQVLRQQIQYLDELEHKKHYKHLFVALQGMEKNINSFKDKNVRFRHENHIYQYEFVRNFKIDKLIKEDQHIGKLKIECDGSEEVIEITEEKVAGVADKGMRDEKNEEKIPDEKENAKSYPLEHENFEGLQRDYGEKLERIKELEESIRKREEVHRHKEIQFDEQLKEKDMTISKLKKALMLKKRNATV
ncbi:uncharacterized protein LOC127838864 [Dreissena polymorpha]|uniref:uncharacterized protein LOC127838864 n=1 Tax=Dreissena polymorpha TaxID=45954 RepID=UPI0022649F81|nr:uncharacterized protein LOC127838864 [Dreissena polymorpha]